MLCNDAGMMDEPDAPPDDVLDVYHGQEGQGERGAVE